MYAFSFSQKRHVYLVSVSTFLAFCLLLLLHEFEVFISTIGPVPLTLKTKLCVTLHMLSGYILQKHEGICYSNKHKHNETKCAVAFQVVSSVPKYSCKFLRVALWIVPDPWVRDELRGFVCMCVWWLTSVLDNLHVINNSNVNQSGPELWFWNSHAYISIHTPMAT